MTMLHSCRLQASAMAILYQNSRRLRCLSLSSKKQKPLAEAEVEEIEEVAVAEVAEVAEAEEGVAAEKIPGRSYQMYVHPYVPPPCIAAIS